MRDNAKGGALTEVTFYILLSLYAPKHGYAVMQFVEEKTGGRLSLGAGTLYGALNSLQDKKWIEPYGDSEGPTLPIQIPNATPIILPTIRIISISRISPANCSRRISFK